MSRRSSKPFFGFLYLMVHAPFIVFWKIGITGFGVGAKKRANQVGRAVFGFPIPILIVPIPFCYDFEQWLHRTFSGLNVRFFKGDGSTEFFWFPVAAFVIPIMVAIWAGYLFVLCLIFDIDFFGHLSQFLNILQSLLN